METPNTDKPQIFQFRDGFGAWKDYVAASDYEQLERENAALREALREIESDEALYSTYFRSPATDPMPRAEWERRNLWLTKARALLK